MSGWDDDSLKMLVEFCRSEALSSEEFEMVCDALPWLVDQRAALLAENERLKDENELLREVVGSMPASYIVAWSDESRNALMALAALPALIALAPLARDEDPQTRYPDYPDTEEREGG